MATVSQTKQDFAPVYKGFDTKEVGLGTIRIDNDEGEKGIYHSKSYRKKKIYKILIGGLQTIHYASWDHDKEPLLLAVGYEAKYNTVIGYNLHYIPVKWRKKVIEYHVKSNLPRIKGQVPMIVHYKRLESVIPPLKGAIRRYKVVGIRVVDQFPLLEWDQAIKGRGKWSNWYKNEDKKSAFASIHDFFQKFIGNARGQSK